MNLVKEAERLARENRFHADSILHLINLYGIEETRYILKALKTPGTRYFLRVNTLKISREELLSDLKTNGFEVFPHPVIEEAIFLPVYGPYTVNLTPKKIIADKKAAESVYLGADLYAAGILGVVGKIMPGDYVTIVDPNGFPVGEGIIMQDVDEILNKKRGLAVKVINSVFKVPSIRELDVHKKGYVYDQSLPAMIAVKNLDLKPGDKIIDLCAAPGGKVTHAAQLIGDNGKILAVDRSKPKIQKLRENVHRLGIKSIKILEMDSRYLDLRINERDFDAVIVDPPCSSLGVRPKLGSNVSIKDIHALANYQIQFLKVAAELVKKGGRILYSTCTMTLYENELNILKIMKRYKLKLKYQKYFLGLTGFIHKIGDYVQRFLPNRHDTPGFFIAVLEKL
ncbi:MAG: RsmB/NOP family class I SAM-dependent RNA methyltransferase [Thermoproteales archaeon]|nr:RsmB/NOP family class I SAM-dependent RNA methyltransferase [Thermoproteales archaeon]